MASKKVTKKVTKKSSSSNAKKATSKTLYTVDPKTKKLTGSIARKGATQVPTAAPDSRSKSSTKAPRQSKSVKEPIWSPREEKIYEIAMQMLEDSESAHHAYQPSTYSAAKCKRPPFVLKDEKRTDKYYRANLYNRKGVHIGTVRKSLTDDDIYVGITFDSKETQKTFEREVSSIDYNNRNTHSDPGAHFWSRGTASQSEQNSNYLNFLFYNQNPLKVEDFLAAAELEYRYFGGRDSGGFDLY